MMLTIGGWPILGATPPPYTFPIPNRPQAKSSRWATEDVAAVMHYAVHQYHARVEAIRLWGGYRGPGNDPGIDNSQHRGAVAFDVNYDRHTWRKRLGRAWRRNYTIAQVRAIREIQSELKADDGQTVIRWGGDFYWQDDMHFEIGRAFGTTGLKITNAQVGEAARAMRAVIIDTQKALNTKADCLWGPTTAAKLSAIRASAYKNERPDVKVVQLIVGARVDGKWGPRSAAAQRRTVMALQAAWGLTPDGAWGRKTDSEWAHNNTRFHGYRPYGY